ncbi:hypothetical protein GON03_16360 [Nocardioides sp. MAH-18]|uniref:DUF4129 domain-containing protein n=1 Tax=Nocardioides agri TaxID=2682843 RepID=A0A6L6XU94_9ACTN|nr:MULTISPECIES: hypothetical protein [unclassified Nocardioides]MBA2955910.1 hypothetical protein [Nocardioides sp. CGMCC 1.13656]MVQ50759.1 hypothetical protein [Nocardioides sp. MAH-18]
MIRAAVPALALLTTLALAGCSGDGERVSQLPTPTRSVTLSPTVMQPTAEPEATDTPEATPSETPTATEAPTPTEAPPSSDAPIDSGTPKPRPTRSPRPTATTTVTATATATDTATATATVTPTPSQPPTESPTPSATPTETPSPTPAETPSETAAESPTPTPTPTESDTAEEDAGMPAWLWWLLAAAVIAGAIAIPLVMRTRRRTAWQQGIAKGEADLAWLSRQLVPQLRTGAAAWTASSAARITATEDRLTRLADEAADDAGRARAIALRDAARNARHRLDALPADPTVAGPVLDEVSASLEAVLAPTQ